MRAGPDLPTGYIGLSLGPRDPRGLQQTVVHSFQQTVVHRVNCRYSISSTIIRQNFIFREV